MERVLSRMMCLDQTITNGFSEQGGHFQSLVSLHIIE
jgi:hypothetical protein